MSGMGGSCRILLAHAVCLGPAMVTRSTSAEMKRLEIRCDRTMLTDGVHVVMVAYSTFAQPSRPRPQIVSHPVEMPPMGGTFVACVVEERSGNSIPRAAIIFKADVNLDCPRMPDFILRLLDSVDAIRKLSRQSNARVVASEFVLTNPTAELDHAKCQEIFYWQYLGHSESKNCRMM